MKKTILVILIISAAFFMFAEQTYGQNTNAIDLVLLLDTSSVMSSSYENVNNYLTGAFLSEFLRIGDTFHLIAFSQTSHLDAARRISGIGDVETIIGRILLQYPVERGSNVRTALTFTEQYITTLPNRPKKIVLVSLESSDSNNLVSAARQRLSARNTTIDYVQVIPGQALSNLPVSGRPAITRAAPAAVAAEARPSPAAAATVTAVTAADTTITDTRRDSDFADNIVSVSTIDDSVSMTETAEDDTTADVLVTETQQRVTEMPASSTNVSTLPIVIGIIILVLLTLGLIFFMIYRRLGSSPNRVMSQAASSVSGSKKEEVSPPPKEQKKPAAQAVSPKSRRTTPYDNRSSKAEESKPVIINPSGPLLLNLFVEDQNTAIGKRNIHSLKSGYTLTVGGSPRDDYYIFLVPMPAHIGEIRRNGSQLTFIPRKPKYFPDIGSNEVKDCINKTIRIVSDKDYEMHFRFVMYEDPLVALNRMLHSVKVPGQ
jgi:hypothetical protein